MGCMTMIRIDDGQADRLDALRGDVPRERFLRRLLDDALDRLEARSGSGTVRAPSSSAAKAGVRPVPKGGK